MAVTTSCTRILCPDCKGFKEIMYGDIWEERELRPCETCSGEGIVIEVKTIEYKRI